MILAEEMSLSAHRHIKKYLNGNSHMTEEDLTAVLRLSQHLRVFGLVSATGYVNQSNDQDGKIRQRTVPVWESLLGQLINEKQVPQKEELMEQVVTMANERPAEYMANWRRALVLANH